MLQPRRPLRSPIQVPRLVLIAHVLLCSIPGILSTRIVTLGSIEIFTTHEWLPLKPIVYFQCQGENKTTTLPDVKTKDLLYTFNGEESWQPLIHLPAKKCKRCGFYEKDTLKSDDVFDEWELCPGSFVDGKYVRFKDNEFNATFLCHQCTSSDGVHEIPEAKDDDSDKREKMFILVVIGIVASAVIVAMISGMVALHKCLQRRKRAKEQARFLKLFEEGDDIEDELGLGL